MSPMDMGTAATAAPVAHGKAAEAQPHAASLAALVERYRAAKADFLAATKREEAAVSFLSSILRGPGFRIRLRASQHVPTGATVVQLSPSTDAASVRQMIEQQFAEAIAEAERGMALEAEREDSEDFIPLYRWGMAPTPDALRAEKTEVLRRAEPFLERADELFHTSGYLDAVKAEERAYRALVAAKEGLLLYTPQTMGELQALAAAILRDLREGDGLLMMHQLDEGEDVERVLRIFAGLD